ncbi:MAG: hypothetical protein IJ684_06545 [Bacteroidales bacterium]|nr:hypothetical protein [Bacteroidales bacterium]
MKRKNIFHLAGALCLMCLTLQATTQAQDNSIRHQQSIHVGYEYSGIHAYTLPNGNTSTVSQSSFSASWNIELTPEWELGFYAGLKEGILYDYPSDVVYNSLAWSLGVVMRYHLLPAFGMQPSTWFDPYLTGCYGIMTFHRLPHYERGIGAGVALYPWQRLGFYVEAYGGQFWSFHDESYLNSAAMTPLRFCGGITFRL